MSASIAFGIIGRFSKHRSNPADLGLCRTGLDSLFTNANSQIHLLSWNIFDRDVAQANHVPRRKLVRRRSEI
jgi:hypothetical protein